MITAEQLAKLKIDPEWLEPLNDTFQRYDINTPLRMAAFIGQCSHESGGFKVLRENLNYSAERLCKVWPSRFPSLEAAQPFHRNPDMIADKVYSGRLESRGRVLLCQRQGDYERPVGHPEPDQHVRSDRSVRLWFLSVLPRVAAFRPGAGSGGLHC